MPDKPSPIIHVRVDDALRDDLKAAASVQRVSVSALIRPALRALATPPEDRDPPPAAPAGIPPRLVA